MRIKILGAILVCAFLCVAQTNGQNNSSATKPQSPNAQVQPGTKTTCPCCKAMADSKDAKSCCHHESVAKDGKEATCCGGKDAVSCMRDDKAKSAEVGCCGGSDQKGCCATSDKASEQTAMACCGGSGDHCGMQHHGDGDLNK